MVQPIMQRKNRKIQTIEKLLALIRESGLQPGQHFPSERKLADLFHVSRNTVREAIRMLEERGIVDVRTGSGCYLKMTVDGLLTWNDVEVEPDADGFRQRMEARYLILPPLIELAAERMDDAGIRKLEHTVVRLSKAIIERKTVEIIRENNGFYRTLVQGAHNGVLESITEKLHLDSGFTRELLENLSEEDLNRYFACYVKVLEAVRNGDKQHARRFAEQNILVAYDLLTQSVNIPFPEALAQRLTQLTDVLPVEKTT